MTNAYARLAAIYRYPVKGMSPQRLEAVQVEAGKCLPNDRTYAVENGPGRFNPEDPRHLPKINFLMLMRNERLASLKAEFDDTTQTLTILRNGKQVARGQLSTAIGRKLIEQFLATYMRDDLRGAPKIVQADGHNFTDVAVKCLHIVTAESIEELQRVAGKAINPLRFRPNLVVEGAPAWSEFDLVGKTIRVGEDVRLEILEPTQRCAATEVDPDTAARDIALPALLERHWGHSDFGVYARVVDGGELKAGAELSIAG